MLGNTTPIDPQIETTEVSYINEISDHRVLPRFQTGVSGVQGREEHSRTNYLEQSLDSGRHCSLLPNLLAPVPLTLSS